MTIDDKANRKHSPQGSYSGLHEAFQQEPKQLPCSYLYDAAGSELYEKITELDEYYLFRTEVAMLKEHATDICSHITPGSVVVELGCGSASKTGILINELIARDGAAAVRFVGIDCSAAALEMAQSSLLKSCPGLRPQNIELVCAEYNDGVAECRRRFSNDRLLILWLGSSIGNLPPEDAISFFKSMTAGGGATIQVLLCADRWKNQKALHAAYCDRKGVTEAFIKNGIAHAFASLGQEGSIAAEQSNWAYEVDVNEKEQQVEMWLRSKDDIELPVVSINQGERLLVEVSRKFTTQRLAGLAYRSGLYIQAHWRNSVYTVQLLVTPKEALERCWADTDALFERIDDWESHPIDIRHPFCFYYGHLAAFAKLKILPELRPSENDIAYSRGIDPDVEEPSSCHPHPKLPPTWPCKADMKAYVTLVRNAIRASGALERCSSCPTAARNCNLILNHEHMHLETLAYMLTQQTKADYLAGHAKPAAPHGDSSTAVLNGASRPSLQPAPISVPGGVVRLGVPTDGSVGFVWDNEGPVTPPATVARFSVMERPVSIGQFHDFAIKQRGYHRREFWPPADYEQFCGKGQVMPATWSPSSSSSSPSSSPSSSSSSSFSPCSDEGVIVHRPDGTSCSWQSMQQAPVLCSLAEAEAYCTYIGGGARIMREEEYERLIHSSCEALRVHGLRSGGWEWTSSPFAPFPGFKATLEYPEYSEDFFDGKHFVLRGASEVTNQTVIRDSFRNFYQRSYPYVFAKFRIVYDS